MIGESRVKQDIHQKGMKLKWYLKPHGNHKAKNCNRYTKDKKKGIKVYHYRKSSIQSKRERMEQKDYKIARKQ